MEIKIILDDYEGPLDLLLDLVEKNKYSIYDINISKIIDDYIFILKEAKEKNLELKADFIIMATELMEIKALTILNKKETREKEQNLEQRIIEYKKFKEIAEEMAHMEREYNISYGRYGETHIIEQEREVDLTTLSVETLFSSYMKLMEAKRLPEMSIDLEIKYNLEEGIADIFKAFEDADSDRIDFYDIISLDFSRFRIVVLFLAVLELYKRNQIDIYQSKRIEIIKKRGDIGEKG